MAPKVAPKILVLVYLFRILFASFRDLLFYIDFMLILAPFCHPFGSLWHTSGYLWPPFGSLLVSFGSLLVPLGRSIFSLWVPPCFIFHICMPFRWNDHAFFTLTEIQIVVFFVCFRDPFSKAPEDNTRDPDLRIFSARSGTFPLASWMSQPDGSICVHGVGGIA